MEDTLKELEGFKKELEELRKQTYRISDRFQFEGQDAIVLMLVSGADEVITATYIGRKQDWGYRYGNLKPIKVKDDSNITEDELNDLFPTDIFIKIER